MALVARRVTVSALLAMLVAMPARAQFTDEIPHASYFASKEAFYAGEYRDAEKNLRRERGIRTTQSNWIDSICIHAMLGEVLFNQGRNAEALAEFDQSCQTFLAYPNWLLQVRFQQGPRPDTNRIRRQPPWGRSSRNFVIGQFAVTESILFGDLNAAQKYQTGGVVAAPMLMRVNVVEIMRATALAIRRRTELLGPLAPQDTISKQMAAALASTSLAPANHWTGAWIDVLRGLAQEGVGRPQDAETLLNRSLVTDGQFDHPLTGMALLELGRIAMARGDTKRAGQMLAEAGFSAFYFEDWDVLTESMMLGWLNHVASGAVDVYAPLPAVSAWAQANRWMHIAVKTRLAQAEGLCGIGDAAGAAAAVEDAGRRMGEMKSGLPAVHQLYLQSAVLMLQGKTQPGAEILTRALGAQLGVSLRNFQILRTNQMYDAGVATPRLAVEFYKTLLADPLPAEWVRNPLDAMALLQSDQDPAFDRWFVAALERKEPALALEIAERAKRRQYLASQPLGGRLLALRAILESAPAELSREAVMQRQQLLTAFSGYQPLVDAGQKLRDQLLAGPILASNASETKALGTLYDAWGKTVVERQQMLAQMAVRRIATSCEFPPLRTTPELQQALSPGEALIEFHSAAGNLYGFLLTKNDARIWQLPDARKLRAGLADFLKEIGNYGANRQLTIAELKADEWQETAKNAFAALFPDAHFDLSHTTGLIIVPDDVLWNLPFEALIPGGAKTDKALIDYCPVRYGPTAALGVAQPQPMRRIQHTGIVANDLKFAGDEAERAAALQELEAAFAKPIELPTTLPEPGNLIAPLLDQLIVMDDLSGNAEVGEAPSILPRSKGNNKEFANAGITMPFGGPEQIVLTGVGTAAEVGLKPTKRGGKLVRPGSDVFQSLCTMMSGGSRTVLMTRWRTGGRTNFDLVREFAKELPNAPAAESWQRACLLAREAALDVTHEPRLKPAEDASDLPTADHPFFWAGYMLIDTGPRPEAQTAPPAAADADAAKNGPPKAGGAKPDAGKADEEKGATLPPPEKTVDAGIIPEAPQNVAASEKDANE
jgi:hypothetical protein